jgi:hypothetical protein
MGLDQSKHSRQAKVNIVDFPTKSVGSETRSSHPTPDAPTRSSSIPRNGRHDLKYPDRLPSRKENEGVFKAQSAAGEKPLRSCLSWDKTKPSQCRPHEISHEKHPKGTCDKCDGPHLTDDCPIYKKKRDDHPDAWRNFGKKCPLEMGKGGYEF